VLQVLVWLGMVIGWLGLRPAWPTKNPLADSAQEVAGERDGAFAVR